MEYRCINFYQGNKKYTISNPFMEQILFNNRVKKI